MMKSAPLIFCLLTLLLCGTSCKRAGTGDNANANAPSSPTVAATETATVPPFATKEPERYQATMVIHSSLGEAANAPGTASLTTKEMTIARDGAQRRVDTELSPGMKVSYLQTAAGTYVLVPSKRIYAEFKMGGEGGQTGNLSADFSPEKLLGQSPGGARYEKLGAEQVNGRATVKYRVTTTRPTGEAQNVTTETLIWIDESLGMPVKSETTMSGTAGSAKYAMELREIKQEVDASLFALPPNYKKVDYEEMTRQISSP